MDDFSNYVRSLKLLREPVEGWDGLLKYLLEIKLHLRTSVEWKRHATELSHRRTLRDLQNFIEQRCKSLARVTSRLLRSPANHWIKGRVRESSPWWPRGTRFARCVLQITYSHGVRNLNPSRLMTASLRLKDWKPASTVFVRGYGTKECNSGSYRQCKEKHHTLIYVAKKPNKTLRTGETEEEVFASTVSLTITMLSNESCFPPPLSTFWTRLESMNVELCWIKAHRWTLSRPRSQIASTFPICRVERSFWMYERLITRIPNFRLSESAIRVPPHITLADSQFCTPRDVNLINGQLWDIMCTIDWGRCYPFL